MKIVMISEDSVPTIHKALRFWNLIFKGIYRKPDTKVSELIEAIEREFPELAEESKVTFTP